MNTLYIRLPSKTVADHASRWLALACPFALTQGNAIGQQGIIPLSDMAEMMSRAQRVVALVAASDVTLWRTQVPPLSPAKLKAALPNLVEDRLIGDPGECAVVAGPLSEGLRTIAVVQRVWLAIIAKSLHTLGARNITLLPTQLCLPSPPLAAAGPVAAGGGPRVEGA